MKNQYDICLLLYNNGKFYLFKKNLKISSILLLIARQIFGSITVQICIIKQILGWHRCFFLTENYTSTCDSIGRYYGMLLPSRNSADWAFPQQIVHAEVTVGSHNWSPMKTKPKWRVRVGQKLKKRGKYPVKLRVFIKEGVSASLVAMRMV